MTHNRCHSQLCAREVFSPRQPLFPKLVGERVDEAVAAVESGRACPFPAVGKRPTPDLVLSEIDRRDLNEERLDQHVERPSTVGPVTRLRQAVPSNDERLFATYGGRQSGGRVLLGTRKTAGRDRGPWRSIDHFVTWTTGRLVGPEAGA